MGIITVWVEEGAACAHRQTDGGCCEWVGTCQHRHPVAIIGPGESIPLPHPQVLGKAVEVAEGDDANGDAKNDRCVLRMDTVGY